MIKGSIIAGVLLACSLLVYAEQESIPKLEVTGLVYGSDIVNSTIVNDFICWEGTAYTVDLETGKVSVRTVGEEKRWAGGEYNLAPKLTLVGVSKRGSLFHYQKTQFDTKEELLIPLKRR